MNTYNPTRRVWRGISSASILALSAVFTQAHPGHALSDATPTHLVASPDHFLVLVITGVLLVFGARLAQRTWVRRTLQSTGVVELIGAATVWGSHLM